MTNYKIDKGIKVPKARKYPWDSMKVGDSIEFPSDDFQNAKSSGWNWAKRHKVKFQSWKTLKGGRIARVS